MRSRKTSPQPVIDAMRYTDGVCSFDNKATDKIKTARGKAECFARFGAHKFKSLKENLSDLSE